MVGQNLERAGQKVVRVNFCTADNLYWRGKNVVHYRGKKRDWEEFVRGIIRSEKITDVVYYADQLPYHKIAARVARQEGANDISYEFGYLRPDWILVERGGQSSYSNFPNDLEHIVRAAKKAGEPDHDRKYGYPFWLEAFNEVVFNLTNYFGWMFYPNYNADKVYNPVLEYLAYIPRLLARIIEKPKCSTVD